MSRKLICIVSGGTGGHVFPSLALAEAAHKNHHYTCLLTDARGGVFESSEHLTMIRRIPIIRKFGIFSKVVYPLSMAWSILYCLVRLSRMQPDVIAAFGGYPCVPVLIAAKILRIPYILHEANSVLGRVNRVFAKQAKALCTAYPKVKFAKAFEDKIIITGNPVRAAIHSIRHMKYKIPTIEGYTAEKHREAFNVLVVGGSQGATALSKLVPQALSRMPEGVKHNIHVQQQCRPEDLNLLIDVYRSIGVTADIKTFFDDMHHRLSNAHLVICRAGASTLAELAIAGRPAILVPYPHAADNHQHSNSQYFDNKKAAILLEENNLQVERLYNHIQSLIDNKQQLKNMAQNMTKLGTINATASLLNTCLLAITKNKK